MTDTIDPNRGIIGGTVREHIQQLKAALATSEDARVKAEGALRDRDDQWQSAVQKLCVDVRVGNLPIIEIAKRIIAIRAALNAPGEPT